MTTRKLGTSDLELTGIGLGTWALGGGDWVFSWGPQDDAESVRTIHAALNAGINWIDTAAVYGLGHAEEVVGRALREWGGEHAPIVATKCARIWDDRGRVTGCLDRRSVRAECEASLRRLGLERIDLYQVHWPEPDEQIEEGWEEIARLIEEGKVRYAGVSNFSVEQIRRVQSIHPVASLQPPYHMLRRDIEGDQLDYCGAHHIGVVVYSPMAKGLLTGKVTRDWVDQLADDDHRKKDPMFNPPQLDLHLAHVEGLRSMASNLGMTPAQLAIAWVLRRPEVTSAIVGARHPRQIEETVKAADVTLSRDVLDEIETILGSSAGNG
jgi:aryl-alcohol dehydrogenase-like predicted oxidoreductase